MQLMECSQAVVDLKFWTKGRGPELALRGGSQRPLARAVLAHRTAARARLVGRRGARPQRPHPPIGRRRRSATAHTPIARASRVGVARAPTPPTTTLRTPRPPAPRPRRSHAVRACIAGWRGPRPHPSHGEPTHTPDAGAAAPTPTRQSRARRGSMWPRPHPSRSDPERTPGAGAAAPTPTRRWRAHQGSAWPVPPPLPQRP